MTTSTNNDSNAAALVAAFQKRDGDDAKWRKKIAPTVEALEKSVANGGFNWDGAIFTSIKKWVPVAFNITYRAWRYRVTGGNQKRGTKKKKGETSVSPKQLSGINVNINGFTLNENSAWVSVEVEQEHRLTYKGAKRNGNDWSQGYPDKDPNAEWIHNVRDVHGTLSFTVENEDGRLDTDKKLVAALLKKLTTILKSMRIWKDSLVEEFKTMVADQADWQEERKEVRRRAAKKGAATRKKKSESGVQKKIDALREFNARNAGEKTKMAPAAQELEKAMAAVAPEGEPMPWDNEEEWKKKSWSDRVCTPGSPEREEHLRQLLHRQEFPYVDPNEGDDDESDEEVL